MIDHSTQCTLIGRMVDTRSIGTGPDGLEIRSAKTGEILGTSQIAQSQVDKLFDSKENEKPRFKSSNFKPPRNTSEIMNLEYSQSKKCNVKTDSLDDDLENLLNRNEF